LQGKDEGEHVVRNTLGPAIDGVESVRSEGARHNPLVVRLVQSLVNQRVVQPAVDPVDEEIGERDEQWELQDTVVREGLVVKTIVQFGVSPDFGD